MELLLAIFFVAFVVRWLMVSGRFDAVEERVEEMSGDFVPARDFAALLKRVQVLEGIAAPAPPPQQTHVKAPEPEPEPLWKPAPEPAWTPAPPPVPPPLPQFVPAPPPGDRLRKILGDDGWEALVGGSLLNKVGALVLVIGIALFLGYSFAHVTAAGRAAISIVVSVAILGSGVWVERKPRFKVFARGLIGAGWAALYATSYAIYAVPEARIIDNPYLGSGLALLVAAGMIAHSLRYRVQAITAVAYFAAFAALAVTPDTPFAVVALIPLAASLLYLAARFDWLSMALFGVIATYLTCIYRGNSNAPLVSTQALFLAYWLLFEGFDLLRVRRRMVSGGIEFLFVVNTVAFLGLSYLTWSDHAPERLWIASGVGSALFLASAMVRLMLRPPDGEDFATRLRAGSYEGALLVSALLAGAAIVARATGVWPSVGLAVEAEILYLVGVRFDSRFLRGLSACGFGVSLLELGWVALMPAHHSFRMTPAALFHAVLFYLNRGLRSSNVIFGVLASALAAIVLAVEVPDDYVGGALILFGFALFELGVWKRAGDFRVHAYALFAGGVAITAGNAFLGPHPAWAGLAISLAAVYAIALRFRSTEVQLPLRYCAAGAVAGLGLMLLWRTVPPEYLALSWAGLTLVLFELGNMGLPGELRLTLLPMSWITMSGLIAVHPGGIVKFPSRPVSLSWFGVSLAFSIGSVRSSWTPLRNFLMALGSAVGMAAIWLVMPDAHVPVAWALLAIALLLGGYRWISIAGIAPLTALFAIGFDVVQPHVADCIAVVAALYACQFLAKRAEEMLPPAVYSVLGTVLLAALLYGQVVNGLTVAWGVEGLCLLGAGFLLRDRLFRIQGLLLLLICILKLFLYDLRNLETVYRILSFVALGLILLAVSWIYSRFRDHLIK